MNSEDVILAKLEYIQKETDENHNMNQNINEKVETFIAEFSEFKGSVLRTLEHLKTHKEKQNKKRFLSPYHTIGLLVALFTAFIALAKVLI